MWSPNPPGVIPECRARSNPEFCWVCLPPQKKGGSHFTCFGGGQATSISTQALLRALCSKITPSKFKTIGDAKDCAWVRHVQDKGPPHCTITLVPTPLWGFTALSVGLGQAAVKVPRKQSCWGYCGVISKDSALAGPWAKV